jgi:hypothetical protein
LDSTTFITKALKKHGLKYDYSSSNYINYHSNLIIICLKHGPFLQSPATHLRGSGCKKCFLDSLRTENVTFIKRCINKFGDKYDYNGTKYLNAKTLIEVNCRKHGIFKVTPYAHLNESSGCPTCYEATKVNNTDKFISKALEVHGERYDYTQSRYVNDSTHIAIGCSIHGIFYQKKKNHLSGAGCPACAKDSTRLNTSSFIKKAKIIHNNKYIYDRSSYINSFASITIKCPIHGYFEQLASNHLQGSGCKQCAKDESKSDTIKFINRATEVHGSSYDYSMVNYVNAKNKVVITCKDHGPFTQSPNNHLQGQGCPSCRTIISKAQQEIINFIKTVIDDDILVNDRNTIKNVELDILIPQRSLAIEYHGLYWHSDHCMRDKNRHQKKAIAAKQNGITLMQIFEHEWNNKRSLLESMIKHKLKLSTKIPARNCRLAYDLDVHDFLNHNHIQGYRPAKHNVCLLYQSEIIGVCSFSKHQSYDYELIRMAFKQGIVVVGGVSKLISAVKTSTGGRLMTYADLRYSYGNSYDAVGFKLLRVTKPSYFYHKNNIILSRQCCQKRKLNRLLSSYDPLLSESENMANNGYYKVYDAGHLKLLL